jgi:DNA-binding PadR family transcriptional regulator
MADAVLNHLYAGFVRLHVLYHADKEPICGVEIMEELRHHGYKIGPGTLYPLLHALHKSGLLSCADEVVAGKRRKNFRITPAGKKLLSKACAKLRELASEVIDEEDGRALRERKHDKQ